MFIIKEAPKFTPEKFIHECHSLQALKLWMQNTCMLMELFIVLQKDTNRFLLMEYFRKTLEKQFLQHDNSQNLKHQKLSLLLSNKSEMLWNSMIKNFKFDELQWTLILQCMQHDFLFLENSVKLQDVFSILNSVYEGRLNFLD